MFSHVSVYPRGMSASGPRGGVADTPWEETPPRADGQHADGTHPTGMHNVCIIFTKNCIKLIQIGLKLMSLPDPL